MATANPERSGDQVVTWWPWEEQKRLWLRLRNAPQIFALARRKQTFATPYDVILQNRAFRLLRFHRQTPARYKQPVLFCYALINRAYILDLQPEKSLVRQYLARGFEVYLIDWVPPAAPDRTLTLERYACELLGAAVSAVLARHRDSSALHLLGYCMGGTLSTLFTALQPEAVATLTLLAAPIDFSAGDPLLVRWADARHFDADGFIDAHGNCPAWFLQTCFLAMNPVQTLFEKNATLYEQMTDLRKVSNHFALEHWVNDNVPIAGETFREFVKRLYQRNELMQGHFRLGARTVDLARVVCPLLLLTASHDHLVPPGSTTNLRALVRSSDVAVKQIDAGHVGLVVGASAQRDFWPAATQWLADRSSPGVTDGV
jgi:polyhydroxyalkanoate synthase